jgi:cytochrome P450
MTSDSDLRTRAAATTASPPGPRMPVALQTALWIRDPQWVMRQCVARFGETFRLRIASQGAWLMVSNPADVEQVFTTSSEILHAGEGNAILEPVLGPKSVLVLDERAHLEQRKLLLPALTGQRMASYAELMGDLAREEIDSWPRGEAQLLRIRMQALTLEIILRAVLGVTDPQRRDALRVALRGLLDMLTDPKWTTLFLAIGTQRLRHFPAFRRRMARVHELMLSEIADRRRADFTTRSDILSLLMGAEHDDGSPMSDRELRDELLTLLVAGHETTANALAWSAERLARHPHQLARLTEEAGDRDDGPYMRAVIQETLRLRPVISIVQRVVKAPVRIAGYDLTPGEIVAPSIYLVNRRPDLYPDPDAFRPERFLDKAPGTYTWIPFGGGVRRCLGAAFAQYEMQVVLRELVTRATIRPIRPESEPVMRRAVTETPRHNAEVLVL